MRAFRLTGLFALFLAISLQAHAGAAAVDGNRIEDAANRPADWASYGRGYDEQRLSPLTDVNAGTVGKLGLAWFYDLDVPRGQEATPLVVDGVMYVSTAWSRVKALDAKTGKLLWSYDPQVPGGWGVNGCCDVVNRGVALWQGKVFIGTFDGRLVALDAATGKRLWEVDTLIDRSKPYTSTGAPRVVKGRVLIGNAGAEFGVRGYISAYDSDTGKLDWRFYIVPGEPGKKDGAVSDKVLAEKALPTWTGEWWKFGGGGTPWDAIAYDPDLDLLYVGTGNGGPWNEGYRSPGGGDNLFLSSILALRPETGEYVWHYQETPGDSWDYTATQQIALADLTIDGKPRKVLLHAPKNGFFYVLDRATGQLISAKPFIPGVNWASGIDMATGRPIENHDARYYKTGKMWNAMPGAMGAHSWHPMSFSPLTGLVYIPAMEVGFPYVPSHMAEFEDRPMRTNLGVDMVAVSGPSTPAQRAATAATLKGYLLAWDPVHQKAVWQVDHKGPANGGTLATAGNLVFQGDATGTFAAYAADTGKQLWSFDAQSPIIGGPIAFQQDGVEYVAVLTGWGGNYALAMGNFAAKSGNIRNISRVLAFRLDGTAALPPPPAEPAKVLDPPPSTADAATLQAGLQLYVTYCSNCHGGGAVGGGVTPDLRYSALLAGGDSFYDVVHDGALQHDGMAAFAPVLDKAKIDQIRAYVIQQANLKKAGQ